MPEGLPGVVFLPRRRKKPKGPTITVRGLPQAGRAVTAAVRTAGPYALWGYAAITAAQYWTDRLLNQQLLEMEQLLRQQDAAAAARYRNARVKDAYTRESERAGEAALLRRIADLERQLLAIPQVAQPPTAAPPPPPTGLTATITAPPPTVPGVAAAAAAATTKGGLLARAQAAARAALTNPLFQTLAVAGLARLLPSDAPKGEPLPELMPEQGALTGFVPEGSPYGELGGPLALQDIEAEPGTEAERGVREKCEKVEPKRTRGQCRQGWFSETPNSLQLKEWSRRPCQ